MEKYQNKYRIPSNRLAGYDYGSHGLYFVTICTNNREFYFGDIVEAGNCPPQQYHNTDYPPQQYQTKNDPSQRYLSANYAYLRPTQIGQIAHDYWTEIPKHYPFVELDAFVVMPNHIHGILFFNRPDKTVWTPNTFGIQSQNLGAIIRAFKSTTKRYANMNSIQFEWQPNYHDHIIRNERALNAIRRYIHNNPMKWYHDYMNKNS